MKIQKQKTNVTATEIGSSMNNVRIKNMKEIETLNKNVEVQVSGISNSSSAVEEMVANIVYKNLN